MTRSVSTRAWYKQRASTGADATLFFVVFVCGTATVVWMKSRDFNQIAVTAVPVALILLYAAIVTLVPYFRIREDQAGDNCYYLGFLFTLVSLSLALGTFVSSRGGEQIVEDFGIALASTITGLVLRVMFNQMRQDPVEIEREARLELAAAAQRLRSELDQAALEINAFRRATQQAIADGFEEFSVKTRNTLDHTLARYEEATQTWTERIRRTFEAVYDNSHRLAELSDKVVNELEVVTGRLKAIHIPSDAIEIVLKPLSDAVETISDQLKTWTEVESKGLRRLMRNLKKTNEGVLELEKRVALAVTTVQSLEELADRFKKIGSQLVLLATGLDHASKALRDSSSGWYRGLEDEAQRTRAALRSAAESIAEVGQDLKEALGSPIEEASNALAAFAKQTESMQRIGATLERLEPLLSKQVEMLSRTGDRVIHSSSRS